MKHSRLKAFVKEALPGQIGAVAAASLNAKNAKDEEPSSASDEFYVLVKYDPLRKKSARFNCKIENIKIDNQQKSSEKSTGGGFFKNIGAKIAKALASDSTITIILSSPRVDEKIGLFLVMKDDKFKAVTSSTAQELQAVIEKEQAPKFINYLLGQSKWKDKLKENFPNIDKQLTPESFETGKLSEYNLTREMEKTKLKKIVREELKKKLKEDMKSNLMGPNPNTNINLNPEVTKAVSRLILKFMQDYQYGKEDAVFAIQQALKMLGYGLTNEALDMNDPVLVKLRANKPTSIQNTSAMPSSVKMAQKTSATTTKKLRDLMMTKSRLMQDRNAVLRDMEQEAEIEGGPIADRYAGELMALDKQISKLDIMIARIKGSGTSV